MSQAGVRVRLLYIDDDPGLARLVEKDLTRHGYDVDWAADGDTGLTKLGSGRYDICALDHYMPGRDGLDVLPEIMALPGRPPVASLRPARMPCMLGAPDRGGGLCHQGRFGRLHRPVAVRAGRRPPARAAQARE